MLGTLTLAHSWAIILNFISREIIFLSFYSPEAGDSDGHFVDIMGCQNTEHNIQKMLAVPHTGEYLLFTLMSTADRELQLAVADQHHLRALPDSSASPWKDKNSKHGSYWMHIAFAPS